MLETFRKVNYFANDINAVLNTRINEKKWLNAITLNLFCAFLLSSFFPVSLRANKNRVPSVYIVYAMFLILFNKINLRSINIMMKKKETKYKMSET